MHGVLMIFRVSKQMNGGATFGKNLHRNVGYLYKDLPVLVARLCMILITRSSK